MCVHGLHIGIKSNSMCNELCMYKLFCILKHQNFNLFPGFAEDECQDSGCDQQCEDVVGGYQCGCDEGYQLDSDLYNCKGNTSFVYPS